METESGDVGIPPLIDPEGRWWQRTWDVTFATAVDSAARTPAASWSAHPEAQIRSIAGLPSAPSIGTNASGGKGPKRAQKAGSIQGS